MAVCDEVGKPLGFSLHGADRHESQCVEDVLENIHPINLPSKIYGDKAYDSQGLQQHIAINWGIELHAPLRKNSTHVIEENNPQIELGKKNRWKIERLFSWLKGFRRANVRWDYHPENFLSWIYLAAALIIFTRF